MIRYALVCADGHAFDAWFRDSEAFDVLSKGGQVSCPQCNRTDVRKALMAPAIRRSVTRRPADEGAGPAAAEAPDVESSPGAVVPGDIVPSPGGGAKLPPAGRMEPVMVLDEEKFHRIRAALRELHTKLKEGAENVGRTFPEEARKIHEGDAPARAIYGTATQEEVRSLIEDGIDLLPLPALPDDRN